MNNDYEIIQMKSRITNLEVKVRDLLKSTQENTDGPNSAVSILDEPGVINDINSKRTPCHEIDYSAFVSDFYEETDGSDTKKDKYKMIIGRPFWVFYNGEKYLTTYQGKGKIGGVHYFGESYYIRQLGYNSYRPYTPLGLYVQRDKKGIVYAYSSKDKIPTTGNDGLLLEDNPDLDWLKHEHGVVKI